MSDPCKSHCQTHCGSPPPATVAETATPLDGRLNPLAYFFTCVALAMIGYGYFHTVPVRTVDSDELAEVLEFHPFEEIPDWQLVIDATFTGVIRRNGAIYSNYDRSAPPKKRSCPT